MSQSHHVLNYYLPGQFKQGLASWLAWPQSFLALSTYPLGIIWIWGSSPLEAVSIGLIKLFVLTVLSTFPTQLWWSGGASHLCPQHLATGLASTGKYSVAVRGISEWIDWGVDGRKDEWREINECWLLRKFPCTHAPSFFEPMDLARPDTLTSPMS